jgi:hypothetical protein
MRFAMGRRWLLILGALGLLAVVGVLVLVFLPQPGDRITRETFDEIREGMTLWEVEQLIGVPPGDYTTGDRVVYLPPASAGHGPIRHEWQGDEGGIEVWLNADGRVVWKDFTSVVAFKRHSLLERLRRRLGI